LGSWVATEETDAGYSFRYILNELLNAFLPIKCPIMPILAEKTIETTGAEEDGEIVVANLRPWRMRIERIAAPTASGANPIRNAISGKRVLIPVNDCLIAS
jgi:valyl-tRNA synthetase